MGKVNRLDPTTIGRIAAGEAVERPAAAVKELVENALDAGARRISVSFRDGGLESLVVTDDGEGMSREDALLALERHATSKIREAEDLWQVETLGFRGEALPSLAAVSHLTITTRQAEEAMAWRLRVSGGEVREVAEAGAPAGTTVAVENLFFNTPVRRKFLKSRPAEAAAIAETVERLALSRPEVAFELKNERGSLFTTSGSSSLRGVASELFGPETARQMLEVEATAAAGRCRGLVAPAGLAKRSRTGEIIFINGRWVRNLPLRYALEAAYHPLLAKGRYPLVLLFLDLPPGEVDVNVHPRKEEIRLQREKETQDLLYRAVRGVLQPGEEGSAAAREPGTSSFPPPSTLLPGTAPQVRSEGPWRVTETPADYAVRPAPESKAFPALRPVAQLGGLYLLAENEEGFYLIDQHAAHERVYFERLGRQATEVVSQTLLLPWTVSLAPEERFLWEENQRFFETLGFEGELLGNGLLLLRAVPEPLERSRPETISDLLGMLKESRGEEPLLRLERLRREVAACKAAIKAGDPIQLPEMAGLLEDLARCRDPWRCPHGRPTVLSFTWKEIRYRFGRS